MGDAEQPALRIVERSGARERFERLQQRLLDDVLAVDRRTGHAGAIAMQLRPQRRDERLKTMVSVRRRRRAVTVSLFGQALLLCRSSCALAWAQRNFTGDVETNGTAGRNRPRRNNFRAASLCRITKLNFVVYL